MTDYDGQGLRKAWVNGQDITDPEELESMVKEGYLSLLGVDLRTDEGILMADDTARKISQSVFIITMEYIREISMRGVADETWLNQKDQLGDFAPQTEKQFKKRMLKYLRTKYLDMDQHVTLMFQHALMNAFMAGLSLAQEVVAESGDENVDFTTLLENLYDESVADDIISRLNVDEEDEDDKG